MNHNELYQRLFIAAFQATLTNDSDGTPKEVTENAEYFATHAFQHLTRVPIDADTVALVEADKQILEGLS